MTKIVTELVRSRPKLKNIPQSPYLDGSRSLAPVILRQGESVRPLAVASVHAKKAHAAPTGTIAADSLAPVVKRKGDSFILFDAVHPDIRSRFAVKLSQSMEYRDGVFQQTSALPVTAMQGKVGPPEVKFIPIKLDEAFKAESKATPEFAKWAKSLGYVEARGVYGFGEPDCHIGCEPEWAINKMVKNKEGKDVPVDGCYFIIGGDESVSLRYQVEGNTQEFHFGGGRVPGQSFYGPHVSQEFPPAVRELLNSGEFFTGIRLLANNPEIENAVSSKGFKPVDIKHHFDGKPVKVAYDTFMIGTEGQEVREVRVPMSERYEKRGNVAGFPVLQTVEYMRSLTGHDMSTTDAPLTSVERRTPHYINLGLQISGICFQIEKFKSLVTNSAQVRTATH